MRWAVSAELTARDRDALADTISFIESGDRGLHLARKAIHESRGSGKGRRSLARATLFAPLEPAVILCSGENYWDHRAEKPVVEGKEPEFFIKLQQCANGPYDDIVYEPKITGKLDYETELAIVIGKGGAPHRQEGCDEAHIRFHRHERRHGPGPAGQDAARRHLAIRARPGQELRYLGAARPLHRHDRRAWQPTQAGAPHLGQRRAAPEQYNRDDDLERPGRSWSISFRASSP